MLKVRLMTSAGTPVVILGLTAENVTAIQEGLPMVVPFSKIGVEGGGELAIVYGKDHADLVRQLQVAGVAAPSIQEPGPGQEIRVV